MKCVPIYITWKQFKQLKAGVLIQHFHLEYEDVANVMMALQCRHYRKERIQLKVMTTWYKR